MRDIEKRKEQQKLYYQENREKILQRTKDYGNNHKEQRRKSTTKFKRKKYKEFLEFKKTLSCARCGNNDYRCLEFHHIDPNEREESISNIYHSTNKFKKELEKCEVLCANCHRIHHFEES